MIIRYTQYPRDYVAAMSFQRKDSAKLRRLHFLSALFIGMGGTCFMASPFDHVMPRLLGLVLSLVVGVLVGATYYAGFRYLEQVLAYAAFKADANSIGDTELEVTSEGIVERRGDTKNEACWGDIVRIVTSSGCTFIERRGAPYFIIPYTRLSTENYTRFMQKLAAGLEAHTLAPLSTPASLTNSLSSVAPVVHSSNHEAIPLRRR